MNVLGAWSYVKVVPNSYVLRILFGSLSWSQPIVRKYMVRVGTYAQLEDANILRSMAEVARYLFLFLNMCSKWASNNGCQSLANLKKWERMRTNYISEEYCCHVLAYILQLAAIISDLQTCPDRQIFTSKSLVITYLYTIRCRYVPSIYNSSIVHTKPVLCIVHLFFLEALAQSSRLTQGMHIFVCSYIHTYIRSSICSALDSQPVAAAAAATNYT